MDWIFQHQLLILFAIFIAVSAILGWQISLLRQRINRIFGTPDASAAETAARALRRAENAELSIQEHEPRLSALEEIATISVQKVGFLRFNPFRDTGGDQSFTLALLDGQDNGVIMTSLFMRDGMRLYAKKVDNGKTKQQLSEEEKKMLEETINKSPHLPAGY